MSELKPCPFCGGEAYVSDMSFYGDDECYTVKGNHKESCFLRSLLVDKWTSYPTMQRAIEAWNRRANDEQADC